MSEPLSSTLCPYCGERRAKYYNKEGKFKCYQKNCGKKECISEGHKSRYTKERTEKFKKTIVNWSEDYKKLRSEAKRASALKQMSNPENRARISLAVKKQHEYENNAARYVMTEAIAEKIKTAQAGKPKEWTKDKKKHVIARKKQARRWFLISPRGESFEFLGMRLFVESHEYLFTEEQLKKNKLGDYRIQCSLSKLSPRCSRSIGVCHGWTWDLQAEMNHFKLTKEGRT